MNKEEELSASASKKKKVNAREEEAHNTRVDLIRICLVAGAATISLTALGKRFEPVDYVAIIVVILGGYPVCRETFESLRHGHINMEVSMAVAIFASLAVGQYAVSALITLFVLISEYIENYAVDRGRATIVLLEKSPPKKALVRRNGVEMEVDTQKLVKGDTVIVRDGERIPVDGTIVIGYAFLNQSAITGESTRIEKNPGDPVYAGSVDESGIIEVRTEKVGTDTLFGKIIQLVEEAENKKAPIQKISDRLAAYLVEFAIFFSVVTFIVTRNPITSISVIVVAGACGVAAGTPLALVATMDKAAKEGAIVKGGSYIEEMSRIDTIVIDKTGTLTFGEPAVTDVVPLNGFTREQILQYAGVTERHSNHPVAKAIMNSAGQAGLKFDSDSTSSSYLPGKGMVSELNGSRILVGNGVLMTEQNVAIPDNEVISKVSPEKSSVLVAVDGKVCGMIEISDSIRAESSNAISELKKMGIRTIMLTGDNAAVAKGVADKVGIQEVFADLLPGDKVSIVEKLVREGRGVVMVGDGINDAPALARANVGIGMGTGTDVAIEEADVVLMNSDLQKIADVLKLSRRAYRTVMTNFYRTVSVGGVGVTLAFLGLLLRFTWFLS